MASNQDQGANSRLSGMVPTNHKEALFMAAQERSKNQRQSVPLADILREAVEEWISQNYEDLPEEAQDLLDEDLKANAGDGKVTVELDSTSDEDVAGSIEEAGN